MFEPTYEDLKHKIRELEKEIQNPKEAEKLLIESKQRYERLLNTIPCALYDYIRWSDGRSKFIYISPQCIDIFEYDAERIIESEGLLWSMVAKEDLERLRREDLEANQSGKMFQSEVRINLPSGAMKWIQLTSMPSAQKAESCVIWSGVILDITDRKKAEEEKDELIIKLEKALQEVKTLSGFIPICASCKKIRTDEGFWEKIETYIAQHTEAEVSHSICQDCLKRLYPELCD